MDMKQRIKQLCKEKKISVNKLEKDLGFGTGYVSKLDKSTPNTSKVKKIADYFNVSVDYLMTGKEPDISDDIVSEHIELISKWAKLSPEKQKAVMDIIDALNGEEE